MAEQGGWSATDFLGSTVVKNSSDSRIHDILADEYEAWCHKLLRYLSTLRGYRQT
jgi:hypothetical protein